ncbi:hypothetical protein ACHHYP_11115 [Achlya hypogyna]|uniref:Crinkler (CRN) family protein n=1 Tax=Achlya hypogyna TaxID=1202772 RepID=A0A1V9YJV1_ACHHY|nr:hypothetical protein ACHHYP_11115 [Achlya hypogyna]
MFVRKCFDDLFDQLDDCSYIPALISGPKGIGKSHCLIYVLTKLLCRRILYVLPPNLFYFGGEEVDLVEFTATSLPSADDTNFWNWDLWVLVDTEDMDEADLRILPLEKHKFKCVFAVDEASTAIVRAFLEDTKPNVFHLPLWSFEDELEHLDEDVFGPSTIAHLMTFGSDLETAGELTFELASEPGILYP